MFLITLVLLTFTLFVGDQSRSSYGVSGNVYAVDEDEGKPYVLQGAEINAFCVDDSTAKGRTFSREGGFFTCHLESQKKLKNK